MPHNSCEALEIRPWVPVGPSKEGRGSVVFAGQQISIIHKKLFVQSSCRVFELPHPQTPQSAPQSLRSPPRISAELISPFFVCFIVIRGLNITLLVLPHARWGIKNTTRLFSCHTAKSSWTLTFLSENPERAWAPSAVNDFSGIIAATRWDVNRE